MNLKIIKYIVVLSLAAFIVFFAFRPSKILNIEGDWEVNELIINGQNISPYSPASHYFSYKPQATVNEWSDSIFISSDNKQIIKFHYVLQEDRKGRHQIALSSNDGSVRGIYSLTIDTTHIGPQSYIVDVKIFRGATSIHIRRERNIPPWKPQFPKRGQV